MSPQWTRDLICEVAREEERVAWGWVHRVRPFFEDENWRGPDRWRDTRPSSLESDFPAPPYGGEWMGTGAVYWHEFHWDKSRRKTHGDWYFAAYVAPVSWMARFSHFVWPFEPYFR